jgi:hypothetical protein
MSRYWWEVKPDHELEAFQRSPVDLHLDGVRPRPHSPRRCQLETDSPPQSQASPGAQFDHFAFEDLGDPVPDTF